MFAQVYGAGGGHSDDSTAAIGAFDAAGVYYLGLVYEGPDDVKTGRKDAVKAAEAFDDTCFGLWYDFYAGEYHDDGDKNGECQKMIDSMFF